MTGAMRKMGVYLGLVEDDAQDDLEPRDQAARSRSYEREEDGPRSTAGSRPQDRYDYDDEPVAERVTPTVADVDRRAARDRYTDEPVAPAPTPSRTPHRITTLHPRTYNEARTLGEQFRDGNPVIMNLSEMEDADAKRLVDFAAGLTFGLRGSIERITAKVFLLSPQKVKVTAEDKARIADGDYPARG